MAENTIENKVILTGDGSQLVQTFEQLVNEITKTREELAALKGDKEKAAEVSNKLAEQEYQLVELINEQNGAIDSSRVSYKQLNDILKDVTKTYKSVGDASKRATFAPAIKSINTELKTMDASVGNFQRNVGNYAGDIEKATNAVRVNAMQVVRELPSLGFGFEQFLIAISNNIPMLIDSLSQLISIRKTATAEQVEMNTKEATSQAAVNAQVVAGAAAKKVNATVTSTNKKAVDELADAHIKEAAATESASIAASNYEVSLNSRIFSLKRLKATINDISSGKLDINDLSERSQYNLEIRIRSFLSNYNKLFQTSITKEDLFKDPSKYFDEYLVKLKKLEPVSTAAVKANEALSTSTKKAGEAVAASADVIEKGNKKVKASFGWGNAITILITLLVVFFKQISQMIKGMSSLSEANKVYNSLLESNSKLLTDINGSMEDTVKAQNELNKSFSNGSIEVQKLYKHKKALNKSTLEGAKSMAQEYVEIRLLSAILNDATKSTEDHTKASTKLLEKLNETINSTSIAAMQTGAYDDKIQSLIKSLYQEAQAQGAIKLLQDQYTETVLKAQGKLIDAELNRQEVRIGNFISWLGYVFLQGGTNKADWLDSRVDKWNKKLAKSKVDFELYLSEVSKMFSFDNLFPDDTDTAGGKADKWFSKWEEIIKRAETLQGYIINSDNTINLNDTWKYSEEGLDHYLKKFAELAEHYKDDERQLQEIENEKRRYLNDYSNYHIKLQIQWNNVNKTSRQADLDNLEDWYKSQIAIYTQAGEDTTKLTEEYNRRKEEISIKYQDKYSTIMLEGIDKELADLKIAYEAELREAELKGIETVNLTLKYEKEKAGIISKYAAENVNNTLAYLAAQKDNKMRFNDLSLRNANLGGDRNADYARFGGTSVTNQQLRQNEIAAVQNEYDIWRIGTNAQILAMEDALKSEKIIGEERISLQQELANAQNELAYGSAEYQMQLNEMLLEDTRLTAQERIGYIETSFSELKKVFDDVYSAIESNIEVQVEQGKLSEEEGEKALKKYRGVKAAGAAMDAFASASGAYKSLVDIPVVGPFIAPVAAATALAAGLANVKSILALTSDNAGSSTSSSLINATPALSTYAPQYTQNVTSKSDTDYLANALSSKPIKAYVVESEITNAQEVANKRSNETSW